MWNVYIQKTHLVCEIKSKRRYAKLIVHKDRTIIYKLCKTETKLLQTTKMSYLPFLITSRDSQSQFQSWQALLSTCRRQNSYQLN